MSSQQGPQRLAGVAAGQVEAHVQGELADTAADLEQAQPEGVELQVGVATRAEPAAQGVEQPVDGGVQDQPKLVGPEAVVAQTVGVAGALQVFNPEFGLASVNVPIVEGFGVVRAGGHDKTGV